MLEQVLCIGDDRSDEDMFQGLETMAATYGAPSCTVYSATVGQKPSLAPYYVNDQGEVLELLRAMVSSKQKPLKTRSYSMPCFDSLQVRRCGRGWLATTAANH
jgi:trehalose 6-phosphate synthase/phosphatase